MPVKIAITHTRYTKIGGVEGYIRDLVARLLAAGHEVHYFCQWWDQDADPRIRFHALPHAWKPIRFLKVREFDRACTREVRSEDWDVVHGFSKSSVQDVYTDGSGTLEDYQTYSLDATGSPLARLFKKVSLHQREVAAIERRRFTRGNFKKIIAMSKLAADQICRRYGLTRDEVEVVYNGIDLARFSTENRARFRDEMRAKLGLRRDELVGNDWRRKGVDMLLQAMKLLQDEVPQVPFRALVIGKERPSRQRELVKKGFDLGVAERMVWRGPEPGIEKVFAACDVFALPTRFDIFGQVVLESMASGVPPIVARAAGAAECIDEGKTGFVIEDAKDARTLATRLRELLTDAARREAMGRAAAEAARAYSWDRHFQRVLEIYGEVARAKKGAGVGA